MSIDAILVLIIMLAALVLFATEILSVDLIALLILLSLVFTGVLTPEEGILGFSNPATITVAFMFVLSAALIKTGILQVLAPGISRYFKSNFTWGMCLLLLSVALFSSFLNNTPVVAIFIPVVLQIARNTGISASKMLIPLSFATIMGGTLTLIGTSTNLLVSGIAVERGLPPFSMFQLAPVGIVLLLAGMCYLLFVGMRMLPQHKNIADLDEKFTMHNYLTEIQLLENSPLHGVRIMDSELVKILQVEILEIQRNHEKFSLPPGDMVLLSGDVLKIRCSIDKIKSLKDRMLVALRAPLLDGKSLAGKGDSVLAEFVITYGSSFEGKSLKDIDFRRTYRSAPLAIRHREEVLHEGIIEMELRAGDVILAEVKKHYLPVLKKQESSMQAPFIVISEEGYTSFDRKKFTLTGLTILLVILSATFHVLNILTASIAGAAVLVLFRIISMKELYDAIQWKIIFLLAGSLSLGTAMYKSGLAATLAEQLIAFSGNAGPVLILSLLYVSTSLLTEIMSNNAAAAVMAPVAIAIAESMGLSYMPFILGVTYAASASFLTPIGYQTNTMVYTAGQYKFSDFFKVGWGLSIIGWIIATFLIPFFFPF